MLTYCLTGSFVLNKSSRVNKERGDGRTDYCCCYQMATQLTHYPEGKSGYLYASVPAILESPNTSVPCPRVALVIQWTFNVSALPWDALFLCSFCNASGNWPSITDVTVMSTQQIHWVTAKSTTICCPYSLSSKPAVSYSCFTTELYLFQKNMFFFNWIWVVRMIDIWYFYFCFALAIYLFLLKDIIHQYDTWYFLILFF